MEDTLVRIGVSDLRGLGPGRMEMACEFGRQAGQPDHRHGQTV